MALLLRAESDAVAMDSRSDGFSTQRGIAPPLALIWPSLKQMASSPAAPMTTTASTAACTTQPLGASQPCGCCSAATHLSTLPPASLSRVMVQLFGCVKVVALVDTGAEASFISVRGFAVINKQLKARGKGDDSAALLASTPPRAVLSGAQRQQRHHAD